MAGALSEGSFHGFHEETGFPQRDEIQGSSREASSVNAPGPFPLQQGFRHAQRQAQALIRGACVNILQIHEGGAAAVNNQLQEVVDPVLFQGSHLLRYAGIFRHEMEGPQDRPVRYLFPQLADPGCQIPYIQVDDNTYWSGDPERQYNQMVDIRDVPDLLMDDSEHIVDYQYQYQYCLNISFNEDGTPGRGSAIFLHCLGPQKPWTGGCVAVPENIMKLIMQNVREDCVVVIDTLENLGGSL